MEIRMWFIITFVQFVLFYIALVVAQLLPPPAVDAGVFYRYFFVVFLFSVVTAIIGFFNKNHPYFSKPYPKSEQRGWFRLLYVDATDEIRINWIGALILAAGLFVSLWGGLAFINLFNSAFEVRPLIPTSDGTAIFVFALLSLLVGIFAPWMYKLEAEYRTR